MLNLQRENLGATSESQESENEEDQLVDDEDDDVICLDCVYEIVHENITKRKISVSHF